MIINNMQGSKPMLAWRWSKYMTFVIKVNLLFMLNLISLSFFVSCDVMEFPDLYTTILAKEIMSFMYDKILMLFILNEKGRDICVQNPF
jgi:hypothetical protein